MTGPLDGRPALTVVRKRVELGAVAEVARLERRLAALGPLLLRLAAAADASSPPRPRLAARARTVASRLAEPEDVDRPEDVAE